MSDSSHYKPGQRITSISRAEFLHLWQEIQDGTLSRRWPKGKEPVSKKEQREARQLSALAALYEQNPESIKRLLTSKDWTELEFVLGPNGLVRARARHVKTRKRDR